MQSIILDMAKKPSPWLDASGYHSDSVISSRVRLARNIRGFPFPHKATKEQLCEVVNIVTDAIGKSNSLKGSWIVSMDQLDELERQFLVERHLISHEHAEKSTARAIAVGDHEMTSVMINEEDHLRVQSIQAGFQVTESWRIIDRVDDELDEHLEYVFSYEWGYLTSCPTNTGTGLRASMLVHIPGLVLTKQIDKVIHSITQMGLAVRGFFGEGSDVVGNLFQISNRTALGTSETDIIETLERVVTQVLDYERKAQEILLRNAKNEIEDKVWRSYGILRHCRKVAWKDVMSFASALRLGISLGMIKDVSIATVNKILFTTQPAHLQNRFGRKMDPNERDVIRAEVVRKAIEEDSAKMPGRGSETNA